MKRPSEIAKQLSAIGTLVELTGVFKGIASMRIAQIKDQVLQSQEFFSELWVVYSQIKVDPFFGFGRSQDETDIIEKELFIIITAEGGFSGEIDAKLIQNMLEKYDKDKNDIIVIGHHGAVQLAQNHTEYKKYFKLPTKDQNINVMPIIREVQKYKSTRVYYQTYVSLMLQEVKSMSLTSIVEDEGKSTQKTNDYITMSNYILEPSPYAVVDHLESSMMSIALSQVILDSKLAQYASRFRAMSGAKDRADESFSETRLSYNRARRGLKDERLKEIVNGMRKKTNSMAGVA
jgi:F-type H+-transporting ATPase subunit gamma